MIKFVLDWIFLRERHKVKVYKKNLPNNESSNFLCVKGVGQINASPEVIKSTIKDVSQTGKWDPLFLEGMEFLFIVFTV